MPSDSLLSTRYLTNAQEVRDNLARWRQASPLVLDTEFIRVDTFFPILGLVQIGDGHGEDLLDPLAIKDMSCLSPLFGVGSPVKVLHACSEDLEVLSPLAPEGLGEVHDTQIGLAMLGEGLQLGYQKALQQVLGIDIPKDASRSDWLQRPLTQQQLDYAALDVRHLPALYDAVKARLETQGLWAYYRAECAEVCRLAAPVHADTCWQDHANAWRLQAQGRAVLQAVMAWREQQAVARNVPRGHLLKPLSLFEIARRTPNNMRDLQAIPELNPRVARRDGEQLLDLIDHALALPAAECPLAVPPPLPREAAALYDDLKAALQPVSLRLGIPIEVLWRKRLADKLVLAAADHGLAAGAAAISGWRAELLPEVLLPVLTQHQGSLQSWARLRRVGA